MGNIAAHQKELKDLRADFDKFVTEDVAGFVSSQDAEIKRLGATTTATAAALSKSNDRWNETAAKAQEIVKAIEALQLESGRLEMRPGNGAGLIKSLGQHFIESAEYKSMIKSGNMRSDKFSHQCSIHQLIMGKKFAHKSGTTAELGALVDEMRWNQVIQEPLRPRRIADLIPMTPTSSNQVEYARENLTLLLVTDLLVAAVTTDTVLQVTNANGFEDGQVINLSRGEASFETATIDVAGVDRVANTLTLTGGIANNHPIGRNVDSDRFSFTNEAEYKPYGEVQYTLESVGIKTLATLHPLSKQMASDSAMVQSLIDGRMREFLELALEYQILYGDGTVSTQINGILNDPDINTYLQVGPDEKLDAIRRAMTLVFLNFYPADAVVLHPIDWEDIELTKGTDDHYIFNQAPLAPGVTNVWRARVVETPVINQGSFLAGSFRIGAMLWDRQQAEMSISDQNRDNFETNLLTMRVEQRIAQSVLRPTAFVDGTFI